MTEEHASAGKPKKESKSSVGALPLIIFIGFILFCYFAITLYGSNKPRAYNSHARATLHNIYLVCNKYWEENGGDKECLVDVLTSKKFGAAFIPEIYGQGKSRDSTDINRTVCVHSQGTKNSFKATARHRKSTTEYSMNGKGEITPDYLTPPNMKRFRLWTDPKEVDCKTVPKSGTD